MAKYFTCDRETGDIIDKVETVSEGKMLIALYEKEDKRNRVYQPNFYDVVDINRTSVL